MGPRSALLAAACALASGGEERLIETTGSVVVLQDGRLHRERDGTRLELGCTDERGPGRVLDVAADPAGLVFVAAERGLHVLGPFVDVLDPFERIDGAPAGAPTALHVDAERRVWLATESALGVLEPSFGWGRTLAPEELPGAGPYRLSERDGALVLTGAAGTRAYVPDAGPPPELTRLRVDGREVADGARIERDAGGILGVEAEGTARGGATFRYRFDRHHVWRALPEDGALPLPHPGAHVLEVVAVDQDLRRSRPRAVRLAIPYPPYYAGRFVVGAAIACGVLASAAFLLGSRALHGRVRLAPALVSTGLALALLLQGIAGSVPHAKGWPFVGFGMYVRSFSAGELVYDERLVGLRPDGSELVLRPRTAGVAVDELWDVARPLIDGGAPALRAFLEDRRQRFPATPLRGMQVQARRSRLTPAGPVEVAPLVLAHYLEPAGG